MAVHPIAYERGLISLTAIYARQSIEKNDSLSIDGQIELCQHECGSDFIVYKDAGFSGKNTNRPAFEELMEDVKSGKISKVICYRLDRISRSVADFGSIWDTLSRYNVDFVSVNEKFDTSSPVGRAMLYIIMVFAQLERETIAERVKDNYYQRARNGNWCGGPAPYGFTIIKADGQAQLEVNENIAVPIRIFNMYTNPNTSLGTIARVLSDEGIKGPQRDQWDSITVNRILRNPVYAKCDADVYRYYKHKGAIVHNAVDEFDGILGGYLNGKRNANDRKHKDITGFLFSLSHHNGVVTSDIFLACQEKLDNNKQIKNSGKGKYTWLSGLMKCGHCGYGLKVTAAKGQLYLTCSGRTNLHICDKTQSRKVPQLEAHVEDAIVHYALPLEVKNDEQQSDANANQVKQDIAKVDEKITNLISSIADANNIVMDYINQEVTRLQGARNELEKQLCKKATHLRFDLHLFEFPEMTFEGKKEIAQTLIKRINVTNDEIKIEWHAL